MRKYLKVPCEAMMDESVVNSVKDLKADVCHCGLIGFDVTELTEYALKQLLVNLNLSGLPYDISSVSELKSVVRVRDGKSYEDFRIFVEKSKIDDILHLDVSDKEKISKILDLVLDKPRPLAAVVKEMREGKESSETQ